eukprot:scaffold52113_cov38-Phaeocystis_antarctica.AAC.3
MPAAAACPRNCRPYSAARTRTCTTATAHCCPSCRTACVARATCLPRQQQPALRARGARPRAACAEWRTPG